MERGGNVVSAWWKSLPLATKCFMCVCFGIYAYTLLFGQSVQLFCVSPYLQLWVDGFNYLESYRIITSAFFHNGLLHVAMNMMTFNSIGPQLEYSFGTIQFFYLIIVFSILGSIFNIFISLALFFIATYVPELPFSSMLLAPYLQCAVGFSGVLFTLMIIQVSQASSSSRSSIFGFFIVPTRLSPWIYLFLFSFMFGSVSFIGHLSGICVGYAFVYGPLRHIKLSSNFVHRAENNVSWIRDTLKPMDTYIAHPTGDSNSFRYNEFLGDDGNGRSYLGALWERFRGRQTQSSGDLESQTVSGGGENVGEDNEGTEPRFPGRGVRLGN